MLLFALLAGAGAQESEPDPVFVALESELERTMAAFEGAEDGPYYLGYRVSEERGWNLQVRYGEIGSRRETHRRTLDVSARVGSPALDSTHDLKGRSSGSVNFHVGQSLPLDADPRALQAVVWEATNKEVRDAQERFLRVQANQVVKVDDEDPSADFSVEEPVVAVLDRAELALELAAWEPVLLEISEIIDDHPEVHASSVSLNAVAETQYLVTSEGTRLRHPREWVRVALQASTTAEDGTEVRLYRWRYPRATATPVAGPATWREPCPRCSR